MTWGDLHCEPIRIEKNDLGVIIIDDLGVIFIDDLGVIFIVSQSESRKKNQ